MAFLSSTSSFTRFKVTEKVPSETKNNLLELLRKYSFQDIDDSAEERQHGWTSFDDMLDTNWENTFIEKAEYVCFSMRLDTRRIAPAVLKKHTRIALMREEQIIKQTQGKNYVPKDRKTEIKEKVKLELRARTLPIPAEFQVIWDIEKSTVYFASVQSKMILMFTELFMQTFDLSLDQLTPYSLASQLLGEDKAKELESINPSSFV